MIRGRAELNTVNPPGQIVNRNLPVGIVQEKPITKEIDEFMESECFRIGYKLGYDAGFAACALLHGGK